MPITFSTVTNRRGESGHANSAYTAPAGSNRILFFVMGTVGDQNKTTAITSVTFGGQAATELLAPNVYVSNFKGMVNAIYYIKEADIPAGENDIVIATLDNNVAISCFCAFDVSQAGTPSVNTTYHGSAGGEFLGMAHALGANSGKSALMLLMANTSSDAGGAFVITGDTGTVVHAVESPKDDGLAFVTGSNSYELSTKSLIPVPNNSTTITWDSTYPNDGANSSGNRTILTAAIFLDEISNTSLTIDQATVAPGETISGSYSGFTPGTPPTSPLTLSDGTAPPMSVTISVTDGGDGTGTFTGTVKSLPSAGGNDTFITFDNDIIATLDDA